MGVATGTDQCDSNLVIVAAILARRDCFIDHLPKRRQTMTEAVLSKPIYRRKTLANPPKPKGECAAWRALGDKTGENPASAQDRKTEGGTQRLESVSTGSERPHRSSPTRRLGNWQNGHRGVDEAAGLLFQRWPNGASPHGAGR
jgi:hypothetical protein